MKINCNGSVRVDLLGGTLDLAPISSILKKSVTINLATSLKAFVEIEEIKEPFLEIISEDYDSKVHFYPLDFKEENFDLNHFGPLNFICQILYSFEIKEGIKLTLKSSSPPGAGLGGSSAMGVVLYKALCLLKKINFNKFEAIQFVQRIEAKCLNKGPCGYQDYYPALYGGILALAPGKYSVEVEQLYTEKLKLFFEKRITLVYSGELRFSAINNWEVYKDFFDNKNDVREGLSKIADLSSSFLNELHHTRFDILLDLIAKEGEVREKLFSNIVTNPIRIIYEKLKKNNLVVGMKVCGAGGGGCFILLHKEDAKDKIKEEVLLNKMTLLDFEVVPPLE